MPTAAPDIERRPELAAVDGVWERLGDGSALGEFVLRTLEVAGWSVHRRCAFGGGVLLIATHPTGWDFKASAANVTGAAIALFEQCAAIRAAEDGGDDVVF